MADATSNNDAQTIESRGPVDSFVIADGVTLYKKTLVSLEGGYLNHWADGANDQFAGVLKDGDIRDYTTGAITGETSDSPPPEGYVYTDGVTLMHLDSVLGPDGGNVGQDDVGKFVYCSTSNPDDLTLVSTGATHPVGILKRFRSATDVDVKLFSMMEAAAQRLA
jgi:hypothetical protein